VSDWPDVFDKMGYWGFLFLLGVQDLGLLDGSWMRLGDLPSAGLYPRSQITRIITPAFDAITLAMS